VNDALTGQTVELLQQLIRNQCVNDGTVASGREVRTSDVLRAYLDGSGLDIEIYEPDGAPGRTSLVARIEGSDPAAPTLCLMGHTDVVPVTPEHWTRDPFGGELVDGEVWGRGAVDMLNLTASQAVALKALARKGWRPRGTLVYLACADEEAGGALGAGHVCKRHWDALRADYLLTENGGTVSAHGGELNVTVHVGEKGVAWRRLRVKGTPGHGSAVRRRQRAGQGRPRDQPTGGLPARSLRQRPVERLRPLARPPSRCEGRPGRSLSRRRGHRPAPRAAGQAGVVQHAHHVLAEPVPRRGEDQRHP
jgi:acetylornithine deacetylase/succinyl-diaminopimelate desuccinylase-like protein